MGKFKPLALISNSSCKTGVKISFLFCKPAALAALSPYDTMHGDLSRALF